MLTVAGAGLVVDTRPNRLIIQPVWERPWWQRIFFPHIHVLVDKDDLERWLGDVVFFEGRILTLVPFRLTVEARYVRSLNGPVRCVNESIDTSHYTVNYIFERRDEA